MSRLENIEDGLRFVLRNIDPGLAQRFDRERIERARLEAGALRFEIFAANFLQQSRGHLTAGAVVHANKENFLFHDHKSGKIDNLSRHPFLGQKFNCYNTVTDMAPGPSKAASANSAHRAI